jgi:hypothetical protein
VVGADVVLQAGATRAAGRPPDRNPARAPLRRSGR